MSYFVTRRCVATCDTACVDVCPTDCFSGPIEVETLRAMTPENRKIAVQHVQLFINPQHCVDCGACVHECPVDAISYDDAHTEEDIQDLEANRRFFAERNTP